MQSRVVATYSMNDLSYDLLWLLINKVSQLLWPFFFIIHVDIVGYGICGVWKETKSYEELETVKMVEESQKVSWCEDLPFWFEKRSWALQLLEWRFPHVSPKLHREKQQYQTVSTQQSKATMRYPLTKKFAITFFWSGHVKATVNDEAELSVNHVRWPCRGFIYKLVDFFFLCSVIRDTCEFCLWLIVLLDNKRLSYF